MKSAGPPFLVRRKDADDSEDTRTSCYFFVATCFGALFLGGTTRITAPAARLCGMTWSLCTTSALHKKFRYEPGAMDESTLSLMTTSLSLLVMCASDAVIFSGKPRT